MTVFSTFRSDRRSFTSFLISCSAAKELSALRNIPPYRSMLLLSVRISAFREVLQESMANAGRTASIKKHFFIS